MRAGVVARALVAAAIAAGGCQGGGGGDDRPRGDESPARPAEARDAAAEEATRPSGELEDAGVAIAEDAGPKPEEPEIPDPGKLIAELGAIPAWQAVVDRAQLLGRRGQRGVVFGRVGPAIADTPYVWFVDDTEGNGSLGIRVRPEAPLTEGARVALGGAWELDADRRWFWKVDAVQAVPPRAPSDLAEPPPAVPDHSVPDGRPPPGARMIGFARDNDLVYFQLVGPPPTRDGEGWLVANELGDKPVALMTLPGERPSYGGQDMRARDERWQLRRGQTYWVRIGKLRKRADQPALVTARTGPVRVP